MSPAACHQLHPGLWVHCGPGTASAAPAHLSSASEPLPPTTTHTAWPRPPRPIHGLPGPSAVPSSAPGVLSQGLYLSPGHLTPPRVSAEEGKGSQAQDPTAARAIHSSFFLLHRQAAQAPHLGPARRPCVQVCPPAIGCPPTALTPCLPAPALGASPDFCRPRNPPTFSICVCSAHRPPLPPGLHQADGSVSRGGEGVAWRPLSLPPEALSSATPAPTTFFL